jgi:hypothetical protein
MMPPSSSSTTHDILSLQLVDDPPPVFKPVAQFTSQYYRSTIWSQLIQQVCNLAWAELSVLCG